jgi:hypothetical protein
MLRRYRNTWRALAIGALMLGWLQGWSLINFGDMWTQLLIQWLTALFSALFGGSPSTLTA